MSHHFYLIYNGMFVVLNQFDFFRTLLRFHSFLTYLWRLHLFTMWYESYASNWNLYSYSAPVFNGNHRWLLGTLRNLSPKMGLFYYGRISSLLYVCGPVANSQYYSKKRQLKLRCKGMEMGFETLRESGARIMWWAKAWLSMVSHPTPT